MPYFEYSGQRVYKENGLCKVYVEETDKYQESVFLLRKHRPYLLITMEEMVGTLTSQFNDCLEQGLFKEVRFANTLRTIISSINGFVSDPVFSERNHQKLEESHIEKIRESLSGLLDDCEGITINQLSPIEMGSRQLKGLEVSRNSEGFEWTDDSDEVPIFAALVRPNANVFEELRCTIRVLGNFADSLKATKKYGLDIPKDQQGRTVEGLDEETIHTFKRLIRLLAFFGNSTSASRMELMIFDEIELELKSRF